MLGLLPHNLSFFKAEYIKEHLYLVMESGSCALSSVWLLCLFSHRGHCFEWRSNWPHLVMDLIFYLFFFQLSLVYLWVLKSLPHKIRKRGSVLFSDFSPYCCIDHHPLFPSSTWNHGNSTQLLVFCSALISFLS